MRPPVRRPRIGPRLTPVVTALIVANIATFVLFAFSGKPAQDALTHWLVLTPSSLLKGHVWKLLTTSFFNENGLALFLDILVLWLFMPFLEGAWGRRRFITFALATTLAGNVVSAGLGLLLGGIASIAPIQGLAPFIFGAVVGYGVQFAEQQVQFFGVFPMKGKTLAIGTVVVLFLSVIMNGTWVVGAGYVAAMVTALFLTSDRFSPRLALLRWRRARLRRRYRVLQGGDGSEEGRGKKQWLN
jgi:rhomboid family protein